MNIDFTDPPLPIPEALKKVAERYAKAAQAVHRHELNISDHYATDPDRAERLLNDVAALLTAKRDLDAAEQTFKSALARYVERVAYNQFMARSYSS